MFGRSLVIAALLTCSIEAVQADVIVPTGNVGVGTANPSTRLVIQNSANGGGASANVNANNIAIIHNDNTGLGNQLVPAGLTIVRDKTSGLALGDILGGISWDGRYDAEDRGGFANILAVTNSIGGSADITFNPATSALTPAEVMRITGAGNVGIGTASPGFKLEVNGSVAGIGDYHNVSDRRLKKNIMPISNGLDIVEHLQGVHFQWRAPAERDVGKSFNLPVGDPQIGFIAQDLKNVLPEAVSVGKDSDAIMRVAESKVVPVLVEAIKELKIANDNQAAELRRLRAQQTAEIGALKTKISALQRVTGVRTASN